MSQRPKRAPSFSVEFDRAIARARIAGKDQLADHLEALRPKLNLSSNDEGEVFALASRAFAEQLLDVCQEINADAFDVLLILAGAYMHVLNRLHHHAGVDFMAATNALIKAIEHIAARMKALQDEGVPDD
jgi:hypothetical protein